MAVHHDALNLDDALIEKLVRRANDRKSSGERPVSVTSPTLKTDFPRLLCLDLNKWIDMARAHYGRPDGAQFRPALDAVRAAVGKQRLVVPVTAANAMEAVIPKDEERRRRLAEFMVSLSGNHSLVNDNEVVLPEIDDAVSNLYLGRTTPPRVRPVLVQRGMTAAILGRLPTITGVDRAISEYMVDLLHEPEVSIHSLMYVLSRNEVAERQRRDEETAQRSMKIRQAEVGGSVEDRRRAGVASLFSGGAAFTQIRGILKDRAIDESAFFGWLRSGDNALKFAERVPGIDVMVTLIGHRNQNPAHTSHKNDARDFSFLRVAVPYANYVTAENSWGHFVRTSGLTDKYGTRVVSDLKELPTLLSADGCL